VERPGAIRGGTDSGHGRDATGSRGDTDSNEGCVTISAISPTMSIHFWQADSENNKTNQQQSEILMLTLRKVVIEETEEMKRKNKCEENVKERVRKREKRKTYTKHLFH
jgi:hypothetical protein